MDNMHALDPGYHTQIKAQPDPQLNYLVQKEPICGSAADVTMTKDSDLTSTMAHLVSAFRPQQVVKHDSCDAGMTSFVKHHCPIILKSQSYSVEPKTSQSDETLYKIKISQQSSTKNNL